MSVSFDGMHPPAITRQRRPFLAPIWLGALLFLAAMAGAVAAYRAATTTTVVIVRHAEKQLGTIGDPPLAPAGELRAQQLARMFGDSQGRGRIQAIFVSDARRAQQTAAPLAARLRTSPIVVATGDASVTARQIRRDHRGETVLVIGHGNTVPELIHELSGVQIPPIGEDEYDNLFVVSIPSVGTPGIVRLRY